MQYSLHTVVGIVLLVLNISLVRSSAVLRRRGMRRGRLERPESLQETDCFPAASSSSDTFCSLCFDVLSAAVDVA